MNLRRNSLLFLTSFGLVLSLAGCKKKAPAEVDDGPKKEVVEETGEDRADIKDFFKGKYSKSSAEIEGTHIALEDEASEEDDTSLSVNEKEVDMPGTENVVTADDVTEGTGPYFKRNYGMYGYRAVTMSGPVDVDVINSKGVAVYKSVGGVVQPIETAEIQSGNDAKTGERVDLYGSDSYTVTMKAREDGKVYLSVVEVYSGTGEPRRLNTYDGVDVKAGDYLRLNLGKYTEDDVKGIRQGSGQEYVILKNDTPINAKTEVRGDDVAKNLCTVNIYEGSGNTKGLVDTKVIIKGTGIRLKPTQETRNFLGWFVGQNRISEDKEYLYVVNGDVDINGIYQE